jgi:hypothetical protein
MTNASITLRERTDSSLLKRVISDGLGGQVDEIHDSALKAGSDLVALGQHQYCIVEYVRPVAVPHVSVVYRFHTLLSRSNLFET